MRGIQIDENGVFRISRRTSELNSVKILHGGSCGLLEVSNGKGRPLFRQPSAFSGSFPLGLEAEDGLIIKLFSDIPPSIQVSWREPDKEVV